MARSVNSWLRVLGALVMLIDAVRGPETADPGPSTTVSLPEVLHVPPTRAAETTPPTIPEYAVRTEVHAVTPTCLLVTWELFPPIDSDIYAGNEFRIARVKTWKIELNINDRHPRPRRNEPEATTNEFYLTGSAANITVGPVPLGASVRARVLVKRYYKPDGRTKEVYKYYNIDGADSLELPRYDSSCVKPYGKRESPCSSCVCTSSAFSGPNCTEANFHPRNVSVLIKSDMPVAIQWEFNAREIQRSLQKVGYNLTAIFLNITDVRTSSVVISDSVAINNQSNTYYYQVYQNIAAGSEYDVIVGVAATSTSARIVMANAAPVKTFIPEMRDGRWRDVILPSVSVGVAVVTCLVTSVVSVIITICCVQVLSSKREQTNNGAVNLASHLQQLNNRSHPNMDRNPAYGQILVDSTDASPTQIFPFQSGQFSVQTEQYENTADTADKTGTGTYDYIN